MKIAGREEQLKTFGRLVLLERTRLRMTQAELSEATKIARPTISMIESGKRFVNQFEFAQLAQVLRVPMEHFFSA